MCDIFGSDDPDIVQTTNTTSLPPWLDAASQHVISRARTVSERPYQAYTGPRTAPLAAGQQSAIDTAMGARGLGQPYMDRAVGYNARAAKTLPEIDINQYMNPYIGAALQPALREMGVASAKERNSLASSAVSRGAFGGDRGRLNDERAYEKYLTGVGDVTAQQYAAGYDRAVGAFGADRDALARAGEAETRMGAIHSGLVNEDIDRTLTTGALKRGVDQTHLDQAYKDFIEQRDWDERQLDALIRAISGTPYPRTTTSEQAIPQGSTAGQIGGLALAAGGLASKFIT